MPSIFPATADEINHKFKFVIDMLAMAGLPLMEDDDLKNIAEKFINDISQK